MLSQGWLHNSSEPIFHELRHVTNAGFVDKRLCIWVQPLNAREKSMSRNHHYRLHHLRAIVLNLRSQIVSDPLIFLAADFAARVAFSQDVERAIT